MPYVNIKVTKEGGPNDQGPSPEQKAELISKVLNKNPSTTVVVIDEVSLDNWGIGGLPVPVFREQLDSINTP